MSSYKCIREKKKNNFFHLCHSHKQKKKEKDFKKCSYCVFSSTGRQTIEEAILQRLLIKLVVSQNELKSKPVYLKSWPLVGIASIKLFTIMLFNIRTQCHNESSFNVWATLDGGGVCHITFKLKKIIIELCNSGQRVFTSDISSQISHQQMDWHRLFTKIPLSIARKRKKKKWQGWIIACILFFTSLQK